MFNNKKKKEDNAKKKQEEANKKRAETNRLKDEKEKKVKDMRTKTCDLLDELAKQGSHSHAEAKRLKNTVNVSVMGYEQIKSLYDVLYRTYIQTHDKQVQLLKDLETDIQEQIRKSEDTGKRSALTAKLRVAREKLKKLTEGRV